MYGEVKTVITRVIAKPCKKCGNGIYDVIVKLLDGSRVSAKVPIAALVTPKTDDIWWDADMIWELKNGLAYIKGTDIWTKPTNVEKPAG